MKDQLSSITQFLLVLLIFPLSLKAQEKIEILNADKLIHDNKMGDNVRRLIGNVKLLHNKVYLNCDSAFHFYEKNKINAYGHVHITKGDSLEIFADTLLYNGATSRATLYNRVKLTDKQMVLTTSELSYDLKNNNALYTKGAVITNEQTTLTSKTGQYFANTRNTFFRYDVVLKDPNYTLYADTLQYNLRAKKAYFLGPTNIVSEENTIYCERGWYDTRNEKALFVQNTHFSNPPQSVRADSLYYDRKAGYGRAICNVEWSDTVKKVMINSDYAEFYRATNYIFATKKAMLTNIIDDDSLFLKADTLISYLDSLNFRVFSAFHHVKFFKSDLQGLCDSVAYSYSDSTFHMYYDPVLWSNNSQMTADTITMRIEDNELKKLTLRRSAFIINESDLHYYDQIKGKNTYGLFENSQLSRMFIEGNGQSIYYGKDDDKAYIGVNKIVCSNMLIYFKNSDIDRVNFMTKPEATFHPIQNIDPRDFILKDFLWLEKLRPKSKQDLFSL